MVSLPSFLVKAIFWPSVLGLTVASLVPVDLLPPQTFDIWDKAQHGLGYAWLSLFGLLAYPAQARRVALGLLALGGAIELAQSATGWRYGEWADFAANGTGIVLGATVWLLLRRRVAIRA